ncbi:efflux RND transporter periplasmic adaptor subunit [Halosquirtibacter laminarini]|uniref:Efflux RND transporter periplasmic adaptor subunit n=1 Tax=Halosquirtibacter laminarini TaxID=3374600 RepID=A0AC61NHA6_9BACT|nr:efflux RND transporter periplasmic adaptor subunit [Prolixibacteraceae bacterium]
MKVLSKNIHTLLLSVFLLSMFSCSNKQPLNDKKEEVHESEEHELIEGKVVLNKVQRDAINIKIGSIQKRVMAGTIKTNGRLVIAPAERVNITTYIGGIVKQIPILDGKKVDKGDFIAEIAHPDIIRIQQSYQKVFHKMGYLQKEMQRQKVLFKGDVAAGKQYEKASSDFQMVQSEYNGMKMQLKMIGYDTDKIEAGKIYPSLRLFAPISGFVSDINVQSGQYINANSSIATILNIEKLHADMQVYEKDIEKLRIGQNVRLTATTSPSREITGQIFSIGKELNPKSKTVVVHVSLDTVFSDLKADGFVNGEILFGEKQAEVLPESAMVELAGKYYVFVFDKQVTKELAELTHTKDEMQEDRFVFDMVEVIPIKKQNSYIEVKFVKPVKSDTDIVLDGAFYLLSDMKKGETEHSH